jgi:hypothetical protein
MFPAKFLFVFLSVLIVFGEEHASERQKIADKMREGFLMISLKDLLVLPRLLRSKFFLFKAGIPYMLDFVKLTS